MKFLDFSWYPFFALSLFPPSSFVGPLAHNDPDGITCVLLYVHDLRYVTGPA